MKGVSMFRVKLRPDAECQHIDCGWTYHGTFYIPAVTVRSYAERHVQATGHIVNVTIRDITEYSAQTPRKVQS